MRLVNTNRWMMCIAWAGLWLFGSQLAAQGTTAPADPLANSALPTPHLSKDRTTLQRFQAVIKALDAAEKVSTGELELVRSLMELPEDRWFGEGWQGRGMRRELADQLHRLPAKLRELYAKDVAARAEPELQAALQNRDIQALMRVAGRFTDSFAGRSALRYAAMLAWDRGDFSTAAMISAQTLPDPAATRAEHLPVILHTAAAIWHAGDPRRARELLQEYSAAFGANTPADIERRMTTALAAIKPTGPVDTVQSSEELIYPAVTPRWKTPVLSDPGWNQLFDLESQNQRNSGFHSLPAAVPCIAGEVLLLRAYASLQAFELRSGTPLWDCPALLATADSDREKRSIDNPGFRDFKGQELFRYLAQNQVTGSCVADRQYAYFIGERFITFPEQMEAQSGSGRLRNQILACKLTDGSVNWQTGLSPTLAEVYFLSQPILQGGRLYVIGEIESQLKLFVLRCADGELEWQLSLAALKHDLQLHPSRRYRQLAVHWQDGRLICATGAGCVLSLNVVTRNYEWAYRYRGREMIPRTAARMGPFGDPSKVVPHTGWQRIGIARDARHVYFVSPESDSLQALDSHTGELRWELPRQDGLFLAGLVANRLLVVGFRSLQGIDPETGMIVWQRAIDRPSGMGVVRGNQYLLPLESGPVLLVDGASGKTVRGAQGDQPPLGNLVSGNGMLVSLTPKTLEVYGDWEAEYRELLVRLKLQPDDPDLLRQLYHQMRRGGEITQVVELLRELYRQKPNPTLRVQLILTLLDDIQEHPERKPAIFAELAPLVAELGDRPEDLRCRIRAQTVTGDRPSALRAALSLATLISIEDFEPGADRLTQIRSDRALQGVILQLIQGASDAERPGLEQIMESAFATARDSSDPFAVQRFALQFSHLNWGRQARVTAFSKVGIGWPIFRQELSLLDLTEYPDRELAGSALWKLAQEMTQRSFRQDAIRYYGALRDDYADVRLDASRTGQQVIDELPEMSLLAGQLKSGPADPWPLTKPLISKPKGKTREPFLMPIPIDAPPGSLLDRINISVDSHANHLVCQGDWFPGYWEIPLPKSRSPLRELIQTYQGWGLGQLLVVRLGTQLHGISLLDNTGEPNGRVVWSLDLAEDLSGRFEVIEVQSRQGLVEAEVVIFDEFGREVGQVCVMQPGYFCYRHRGEIVVVDTATGRILWRRRIQTSDPRVTGDAEYLYLLHGQDKELETIRIVDGVTERRVPWPFTLEARGLYHNGLAIVSETEKTGIRLRWVRLRDLQVIAEHALPRISHRFLLDSQTLAVFQQDQALVWFQLKSGKLLGRQVLDVPMEPERLSRVHSWQDQHRFYILPSAIPPYSALGQGAQVRGGYRQHRVKGTLHAIDRRTGEIAWKRVMEDSSFPLDQPRGAPVFVLNYRTLAAGVMEPANPPAAGQTEGVLQVLDRRTGLDLYREQSANLAPEFTVEINPENRSLDIHGVTERLRFEYPSN